MTTRLDEGNYLTIQLLRYDRPTELTERYYFLEMSTLQATALLPQDQKIISAKIDAYTDDNKYLDAQASTSFKIISDFNTFLINNPDYHIHNCDLELENGMTIGSHDDNEVCIEFNNGNPGQIIIDKIFEKYGIDSSLIAFLKKKPGHYFAIDGKSKVTAEFEKFDDYIKWMKSKK